jgi:hypothetical protein
LKHLKVYKGLIRMHIDVGPCVFERYKRTPELEADAVEDLLLEANNGEDLESYTATK